MVFWGGDHAVAFGVERVWLDGMLNAKKREHGTLFRGTLFHGTLIHGTLIWDYLICDQPICGTLT